LEDDYCFENEVRNVVYVSEVDVFRFNHIESICYQEFKTIMVKMLYVINALKFIADDQDVILNITIESADYIADVVFI
jgi:hypothetical protein